MAKLSEEYNCNNDSKTRKGCNSNRIIQIDKRSSHNIEGHWKTTIQEAIANLSNLITNSDLGNSTTQYNKSTGLC